MCHGLQNNNNNRRHAKRFSFLGLSIQRKLSKIKHMMEIFSKFFTMLLIKYFRFSPNNYLSKYFLINHVVKSTNSNTSKPMKKLQKVKI